MPTLTLSDGVVNYQDTGSGLPLILLHANPGDSRDFEAVIPALAKQYRVLALDWPGYGGSWIPAPDQIDARFLTRVLREFMTALALPPAVLIGNSVGGHTAARLAIESPALVRGLVLVSPGGFTPPSWWVEAFCKLQSSRFSLSPRRFASLYTGKRNATINAMLARARGLQAEPARIAVNRAMWQLFSRPEYSLLTAARQIKAPTLLVFGKTDPVVSAKRDGRLAASVIPESTLVVLDAGHAPFAEAPALFLDTLTPFLDRLEVVKEGVVLKALA